MYFCNRFLQSQNIHKMKEQKKVKRLYMAPVLTTVTFKTERGYASSGEIFKLALSASFLGEAFVSRSLEGRESAGLWGGNDW